MNYQKLEKTLSEFLQINLKKSGLSNLVLGISGGLDSAVVAGICARNKIPVFGLMLPNQKSNPQNLKDAKILCENLKIPYEIIFIDEICDSFLQKVGEISKLRFANFVARIRMNLLFDYSVQKNAIVVGTSNLSERILGYGTIFGDLACGFNPLGEITKTEIFEFAKFLNIDENIIKKAPSADLWENQTDESEFGFTYKQIDQVIFEIFIKKNSKKLAEKKYGKEIVNFVLNSYKKNKFKLKMPKIAKISNLRSL